MLFKTLQVTMVLNIKKIDETDVIKILFALQFIESDSFMTKKV